jgi:hypothetical protein
MYLHLVLLIVITLPNAQPLALGFAGTYKPSAENSIFHRGG